MLLHSVVARSRALEAGLPPQVETRPAWSTSRILVDERRLDPCTLRVMSRTDLPAGTVHVLPQDLRDALNADSAALMAWQDITALARNEWICWVEDAKRDETRQRRISRAHTELAEGKRRPCCWPGCSHRERNGR